MTCEYEHSCTSRCGNDRDCPCYAEHFCSHSPKHTLGECEGQREMGKNCPQHPSNLGDIPDLWLERTFKPLLPHPKVQKSVEEALKEDVMSLAKAQALDKRLII